MPFRCTHNYYRFMVAFLWLSSAFALSALNCSVVHVTFPSLLYCLSLANCCCLFECFALGCSEPLRVPCCLFVSFAFRACLVLLILATVLAAFASLAAVGLLLFLLDCFVTPAVRDWPASGVRSAGMTSLLTTLSSVDGSAPGCFSLLKLAALKPRVDFNHREVPVLCAIGRIVI